MLQHIKNPHFYLMLFLDGLIFVLALMGAYLLRFDFMLSPSIIQQITWVLPGLVLCKLLIFFLMGMYQGMWRYTGMADMLRLLQAVVLSSGMIIAAIAYLTRFEGFSRGIFILDAGLTFLMAGGLRVGIRMAFNRMQHSDQSFFKNNRTKRHTAIPVMIVGAGLAGEKALRELQDNPNLAYRVMGFVDDDTGKMGRTIHGVPVLGILADLPQLALKHNVQEVLIAIPSATGSQMRAIVKTCTEADVAYKALPGLGELIDGKVSIKALRDVRYEDLLGRTVVELDSTQIAAYLKHRVILVSGAGGSIGRELCRQILRYEPAMLVMLDASEPSLYGIQMELKHHKKYLKYRTVLGSACDQPLMQGLFARYQPAAVFHAAAYKHVPMLERNPWQAVINNVKGTRILMETAAQSDCEKFVMISTDKAVRPTNVMGASKRVCERLMYAYTGGKTRFMAVRFGNVVGSAGSVVPVFREQIERGGPVTVTHPDVTRYFMTIPEACQLVLQAGALGQGGELFVLKMGTPVKIADMARDLIRLSGKEPDIDIEVVYSGLRPGEKLFEELITDGEGIVRTEHEQIMVIRADGCYDGYGDQEGYRRWLAEAVQDLEQRATTYDARAIKEGFKALVPEYMEQEEECVF